jgi:hypothetical protein
MENYSAVQSAVLLRTQWWSVELLEICVNVQHKSTCLDV